MMDNKALKPWNSGTTSEIQEWTDSGLACEKCGGEMQRNNAKVLTTYPPQYEYRCKVCGYIAYRWQ